MVNVGCSEARENAKVLDAVVNDLTTITGQKAIITKAKKSVANFKLVGLGGGTHHNVHAADLVDLIILDSHRDNLQTVSTHPCVSLCVPCQLQNPLESGAAAGTRTRQMP